jgi:DNA-binding MarR family transcriptional regulator
MRPDRPANGDAPALDHRQPVPYESILRSFLAERGGNLDAMAVMFLLFRTDTVTISVMESAALRPYGLTHAGFVLLMTLWMTGPQETRHLARLQRVSKPSIVSAVDTLQRSGLVQRTRLQEDRRLVSVGLTAKGEETIAEAHHDWHECEQRVAGVLTRKEQRALAGLLRKLGDAARNFQTETAATR